MYDGVLGALFFFRLFRDAGQFWHDKHNAVKSGRLAGKSEYY
jgi:hypothetical protein